MKTEVKDEDAEMMIMARKQNEGSSSEVPEEKNVHFASTSAVSLGFQ